MESVVTNQIKKISGKALSAEVRITLKATFPGKKFSVITDKYGWVDVLTRDENVYKEDVVEALNVYNAKWENPNIDAEEFWNGNGGWQKIEYARIEEDGSITPYYYDTVHIHVYNSRKDQIDMFEAKMGNW